MTEVNLEINRTAPQQATISSQTQSAASAKAWLMHQSEYSDMFVSEETLWWYRATRNFFAWTLNKYAPSRGHLLDAGCGTGKNLELYASMGFQTEGLDLSNDALSFCRERGFKLVQHGTITSIPFPAESFDVVSVMDVIGILTREERHLAVQEVFRVLRPGGVALLNCAALEWLRSQHDDVVALRHRFTRRELIKESSEALNGRFEVLRATYRYFLLLPLVAGVKLTKKVAGRFGAISKTDQNVTPGLMNGPLAAVMSLENWILRFVDLPVGSSVSLVLRKL